MIDKDLLAVLVCPVDRTPLKLADDRLVAKVNRAIVARSVKNQGGRVIDSPISGGLIRADKTILYPIAEEIVVLLPDEGIDLSGIS